MSSSSTLPGPNGVEPTFPAQNLVHTASGPVYACQPHTDRLVGLSRFMGWHAGVVPLTDEKVECSNCINAAKKEKRNV